VLVLWVIALLTVMALGLTMAQRSESALSQNQLDGARFRALADAAINLTLLNLLSTPIDTVDSQLVIVPDGQPHQFRLGGQLLEVRVYNERSRIDLNQATPEQLRALYDVLLGPDADEDEILRNQLVDAIIDWRDEDDLTQLNGAEDGDYDSAGLPYGARDDRFQSVEELRQVLGMTPALYRRLAPHLSVDNDSGEIDPEFASAAVLAATKGISLQDAQVMVDERGNPVVPDAQEARVTNRGGPLYRMRVSLRRGDGGAGRAMEALVEAQGGATPPFKIRWRRDGLVDRGPVADALDAAGPS
jgi:general secretion pathway protein K